MKRIRVKFVDNWNLPPDRIYNYRLLSRYYDVEICDNPDYILDGGLGVEHLKYPNAIKIVTIGESYCPDFNHFDYAMGFDHLEFGDRYLRAPLFSGRELFRTLPERRSRRTTPEELLNRGFCSFVVSNDEGDPTREEFFRRLSKYKPVASGGKLFNNVGGRVPDKNVFISKYKFNIAFENSSVPGYTTEKIMEPLAQNVVPIYYGNPMIDRDFHPECMVRLESREDMDRVIEEIVTLDRDDEAYLKKVNAECMVNTPDWYEARRIEFLRHIFDQPLEEARRINDYGYQVNIRRRQLRMQKLYNWTSPRWISRKLRGKS